MKYKGVVIQSHGICYRVWADFVTSWWMQPDFTNLAKAKDFITKMTGKG